MVHASIKLMAINASVHLATMVYVVKLKQMIAVALHVFQVNVSHNDHSATSAYAHRVELVYNAKYESMSAARTLAEIMAFVLN
jgi:hypothetical protein